MTYVIRVLTMTCLLISAALDAAPAKSRATASGSRTGTFRAVICGVATYANSSLNLNYCDDDAEDLYSLLLADPRWQAQNITKLVDAQSTKAAIKTAIQSMAAAAQPGDICLFFFSGHGTNGPDVAPLDEADGADEYICPYDTLDSYDNDIRDDELESWIGAAPAQTVLVLLDSCFSGGMIISGRGATAGLQRPRGVKGLTKPGSRAAPQKGDGFARDLLRRANGRDLNDLANIVVLTACDDDEISTEDPGLEQGLFVYYLLEGMQASGTDTNRDSELSGEELFAYAGPRATAYWSGPVYNEFRQHAQLFDGKTGEANFYVADPGPATVIASVNLDTNPGWTVTGSWAWGTPTGGGGSSGDPDPTSGHTGSKVYGYNLAGDYASSISSTQYLTTTAFNCSDYRDVHLQFWRWLGVQQSSYDHANIQVSNNGSTWTNVWQNLNSTVSDVQWCRCDYDISAAADGKATVYVRWGMGTTNWVTQFCGWNLDDVELLGTSTVVTPSMTVTGNSLTIANGDSTPTTGDGTDFGSLPVGSATVTHTFVIWNTGDGDLLLTGNPAVSIDSDTPDGFQVVTQPVTTIVPGGTAQFDIRFTVPAVPRSDTATVTLASNDPVAGTYTFAVQGTATGPEIRIAGFNREIPNGQATPLPENGTDSGTVSTGRGSVTRTFTILNDGNTDLSLTGSPRVQISGTNPGDFVVVAAPAATVPGGGSVTFQIRFTPGASGRRTALVTVLSNDSDESTYTFAVQGGVLTLRLRPGWNLVSFSVQPNPATVDAVFPQPEIVKAVWGWNGTRYERVDSIQPKTGYWILYRPGDPDRTRDALLELDFEGSTVAADRDLAAGWNLIGPAQTCFPPYGYPVSAPAWRFDPDLRRLSRVLADEALAPGQGYWFHAASGCSVLLGEPTRETETPR